MTLLPEDRLRDWLALSVRVQQSLFGPNYNAQVAVDSLKSFQSVPKPLVGLVRLCTEESRKSSAVFERQETARWL